MVAILKPGMQSKSIVDMLFYDLPVSSSILICSPVGVWEWLKAELQKRKKLPFGATPLGTDVAKRAGGGRVLPFLSYVALF